MAADLRIPISPIVGMVNTAGDATHPPFIVLANPNGSGKNLRIYQIEVTSEGATNRLKMRRVAASGLGLGGTTTAGLLIRKDETDVTAIVATLNGCTAFTGTAFTEAQSFWYDRTSSAGSAGYVLQSVIRPLSFPLIVKPNSSIEFMAADNGAAVLARFFVTFDEV
jgi:hypothetical protein